MLIDDTKYDPEKDVLVFPHIPKTAGISLVKSIEQAVGSECCMRTRSQKLDRIYSNRLLRWHAALRRALPSIPLHGRSRHPLYKRNSNSDLSKTRFISGHFCPGSEPQTGKRHLYISLVRDPVDLFISRFYYTRENIAKWPAKSFLGNPARKAVSRLSLEDYIEWLHEQKDHTFRNIQCSHICCQPYFAAAKDSIDKIFFLCAPMKKLAQFTDHLRQATGLEQMHHHKENVGKTRPKDIALSQRSLLLLENMYLDDQKLYNYVDDQFSMISNPQHR